MPELGPDEPKPKEWHRPSLKEQNVPFLRSIGEEIFLSDAQPAATQQKEFKLPFWWRWKMAGSRENARNAFPKICSGAPNRTVMVSAVHSGSPLQQTGNRAARMFLSFRPTPHHNPNQNETLCYTLTARMRESRSQKSSASCDHSDGGQQDRNWTPEDCESASTFSGNSLLHGQGPNGAKE